MLHFERPGDRERRDHLERVASILRSVAPDLDVRYEWIDRHDSSWNGPRDNLLGLVVIAPEAEGHAQILPIRFDPRQRRQEIGAVSRLIAGGTMDYTFQVADLTPGFETVILQEPWSGPGHLRRTLIDRLRSDSPETTASMVGHWSRYREVYAATVKHPSKSRRERGLRDLAASKRVSQVQPSLVDEVTEEGTETLDLEGRHSLARDRKRVSAARVWWHFPRDASGRLKLRTTVLLARYDVPSNRSPKGVWLIAAGPHHRGDPPDIALRLEELPGEYYEHRWDRDRWMWDGDAPNASADERWRLTKDETALRCAELLEQGAIGDALAVFGVRVTPAVEPLLYGSPVSYSLRELTATWTAHLHEEMSRAAPWLFGPALEWDRTEREQLGVRKATRSIRLFGLGGVNQVRKPGVFLAPGNAPELGLEWSANLAKLRETSWVRSVDFDLVRHGLIHPAEVPGIQ